MNQADLFRAFGDVDDAVLERSEASARRRRTPALRRWGVLAACAALAVGLAAFAAETMEYRAAAAFFQENGLSTEGLSRWDVKAVYRDITAQRFTYGKTAEVLERAVPGLEITQRGPTPEELAALWSRNVWMNAQSGAGISYRSEYKERPDEALGFDVFDRSVLECRRDGELLWTASFTDFYAEDAVITSAGTAAWGYTPAWSSQQPVHAWAARVDETGNILWQRRLEHGFQRESVARVLDNGDGTWAVISRGDLRFLCLSQYDTDGNELSFRKTEVGNYGIWNAVRLGDGYLVQLGNRTEGENARLARLDREGRLTESFTYAGEDCDYYLTDMAEFGGQVYLSAYAVPRQTGGGGRYEIADILEYVFDMENREISSEELTPLVRDNYTAVLLLCDPEGGAPETFYSVRGSLGGKLRADGALVWDVESVVNTFFSPATSSFSIGGTCRVFRYTFDGAGTLLRQEDTGETVPYRR